MSNNRTMRNNLVLAGIIAMLIVMFGWIQATDTVYADDNALNETLYKVSFGDDCEGFTVVEEDTYGDSSAAVQGGVISAIRNDNVSFSLKLKDGYTLNSQPVVFANDKVLSDVNGIYTIKNVVSDVNVSVAGVVKDGSDINYCKVSTSVPAHFTLNYVTGPENNSVIKGGVVSFTVTADADYSGSTFEVTAGGEKISPVDGIYYAVIKGDTAIAVNGTAVKNACNMTYDFDASAFTAKLNGEDLTGGSTVYNDGTAQTLVVSIVDPEISKAYVLINGEVIDPVDGTDDTFMINAAEKDSTVHITRGIATLAMKNTIDKEKWSFDYPDGYYENMPYGADYVFNIKLAYGYHNSPVDVVTDGVAGQSGDYHDEIHLVGKKIADGVYQYKIENLTGAMKTYIASANAKTIYRQAMVADKFTVRFISGDSYHDESVEYKTCVKEPDSDVTWYTSAGRQFDFKTSVYGDMNLYAKEKKTVTFIVKHGEDLTASVPEGSTVSLPSLDPVRTEDDEHAYVHAGWYVDENCTTEFDPSTRITTDTDLYAKWNVTDLIPIDDMEFAKIDKQTYTGEQIKPEYKDAVSVEGNTLKYGQDYVMTYGENKAIGYGYAYVWGEGLYTGSKTVSFQIVPKPTKITYAKSKSKKKITIKYQKQSGASAYVIYRSTSEDGVYKKITTRKASKSATYTNSKLTRNKTYYYKVTVLKKDSKTGKYFESIDSEVKAVKAK